MNKWQIICPLVVVAIAAVIFGWVFWARGTINAQNYLTSQSRQIGLDLVKTTKSPLLVRCGSGLEGRLTSLLSTNAGVSNVLMGDESPPIGDGQAYCRLILTNAAGDRLAIRLRTDRNSGKLHVLGYFSVSK